MEINLIHDIKTNRAPLPKLLKQCSNVRIWPAVYESTPKIGISKAHKQIVMNALKTKKKEVIICEDDIVFTKPNSFRLFIQDKPDDYDLYLGGVSGISSHFTGLFFYMIHERFYKTFLKADENLNLDYALKGLGTFVIHNPLLAITENGHSYNLGTYQNLDKNWKSVKKRLDFLDKKKSFIFE